MSPNVCLTLTARTLDEDIALARKYAPVVDMVELRADCLEPGGRGDVASLPAAIPIPAILTVRRKEDGGSFAGSENDRLALLSAALPAFGFVDLESDISAPGLDALAASSGTRVIRSLHIFEGCSGDVAKGADALCRGPGEMPKIAFMPRTLGDVVDLFSAAATLPRRERIFCAMGPLGVSSRVLARFTGSFLTFVSPEELSGNTASIGHMTPGRLLDVYGFRSIGDATRLCGVAGWPLKVTSSPEVHRALCDRDGVDSVMVPLPCEDVADAIRLAETLSFKGLAVTIPHKEALLRHLDWADDAVKAIGAANTVVFRDGRRLGYNTDAAGFASALKTFLGRGDLSDMRVAILGAGGAARAIAYAVHRMGARGAVLARDPGKAAALAAPYGFESMALSDLRPGFAPDLIVQCTSVGHGSLNPDDDPIPGYAFTGREALYDLVYEPSLTPVMRRAAAAGCKTESGMTMLRAQGELQHRMFHGLA